MNKNYIILATLLVVLAGGLLFLPEKYNYHQTSPEKLMWDIVNSSRFASTDGVANMIINDDPNLLLIDVRPTDDFSVFSLPGSLNLPIDSITTAYADDILSMENLIKIFISDDDIKADQVWILAARQGYKNIYVMKGGLNNWIRTIINPEAPAELSPPDEFELYEFRKAASNYFTGNESNMENPKKHLKVTRQKKQNIVEGGC